MVDRAGSVGRVLCWKSSIAPIMISFHVSSGCEDILPSNSPPTGALVGLSDPPALCWIPRSVFSCPGSAKLLDPFWRMPKNVRIETLAYNASILKSVSPRTSVYLGSSSRDGVVLLCMLYKQLTWTVLGTSRLAKSWSRSRIEVHSPAVLQTSSTRPYHVLHGYLLGHLLLRDIEYRGLNTT